MAVGLATRHRHGLEPTSGFIRGGSMQIAMAIAREDAAGRNYLTWAPVQGTVRLLDVDAGDRVDPVSVTLTNDNPEVGGQLEFAPARDQNRSASLDLVLPPDGSPVDFWVAGVVGKPSSADGDAVIRVAEAGAVEALVSKPVMVRIRKNANQLSPAERDRFTTTLAKLNDQGAGLFKDFREMHRQQLALAQAHGAPGFLSWHRAYLLDLERELQRLDPSVTLPYWLRPARAEPVHRRLHGAVRCAGQRQLQRDQPAASVADRRGRGRHPGTRIQCADRPRQRDQPGDNPVVGRRPAECDLRHGDRPGRI